MVTHSSGQGRRNTEIQSVVLWVRRGKRYMRGRIAASNSNIKTRSSTEFPGIIFACSYSNEGSRLNTEIQYVIL